MLTKKALLKRTDVQFEYIDKQILELQSNLKLVSQKTFRRRDLTLLGLYSLMIILNKVKGGLYSINFFCEQFLLEIGKKQEQDKNGK